jgi:hypothetical protein
VKGGEAIPPRRARQLTRRIWLTTVMGWVGLVWLRPCGGLDFGITTKMSKVNEGGVMLNVDGML